MDRSKLQNVIDMLPGVIANIEQLKTQGEEALALIDAEKALAFSEGKNTGLAEGKEVGYQEGLLAGKSQVPEDSTPFSQEDLNMAVELAVGPLNEKIVGLEARIVELENMPKGATAEEVSIIKAQERARVQAVYIERFTAFLEKDKALDDEFKDLIDDDIPDEQPKVEPVVTEPEPAA